MRARVRLPAPRKYRNQPQVVDGLPFDSKKEAARYQELKLLQAAGQISNLVANKKELRYDLYVNDELICAYEADFQYDEKFGDFTWAKVVEDVKGMRTAAYRIKKKLMKAIFGIEIREV